MKLHPPPPPHKLGFSLLEVLIAVAAIGMVASFALAKFSASKASASQTKLESDVVVLNQAVKVYQASGGDFVGATTPQQVVNKMKTRLSDDEDAKQIGLGKSVVDTRLRAVTAAEQGSNEKTLAAIWDADKARFETAYMAGVDPDTAIVAFVLEESLAGVDYGEETRESAMDYNSGDGWIWEYSDGIAPTAITLVPTEIPTSDIDSDPIDARRPPLGVGEVYSLDEDGVLSVADTASSLLVNDVEYNGLALTVHTYQQAHHGTVTVAANGTFSYVPVANYYGRDTFDYTISNGEGGIALSRATISIAPVNDAPTMADDSNTIFELVDAYGGNEVAGSVAALVSDVDPEDTHTFSTASAGLYGTFSLSPDGSYRYELNDALPTVDGLHGPGADTLTETFAITADDGNGESATGFLVMVIDGRNDFPELAAAVGTVSEKPNDTSVSVATGLITATDIENQALTFATLGTGAYGNFLVDSDGSWTYELDNALEAVNALGPAGSLMEIIPIKVTDEGGATDTENLVLTITGINDAPSATGDALAVAEGLTADSESSDTGNADLFDPEGDPTFALVETIEATYGTLTVAADGGLTYVLDNTLAAVQGLSVGGLLSETLEITVSDGIDSRTAEVTVDITGTNDGPEFKYAVVDFTDIGQWSGAGEIVTDNSGKIKARVRGNDTVIFDIDETDLIEGVCYHLKLTAGKVTGSHPEFTLEDGSGELDFTPMEIGESAEGTEYVLDFVYSDAVDYRFTMGISRDVEGNGNSVIPVADVVIKPVVGSDFGSDILFEDPDQDDTLVYGAYLENGADISTIGLSIDPATGQLSGIVYDISQRIIFTAHDGYATAESTPMDLFTGTCD